jgi:serine phosphatase RsbU (regulator of sigma subunit)
MRIRSQLVVALLLLAIVPLAGIVLYSYTTSLRAVRQAVEAEAGELARDMEARMSSVQQSIENSFQRVASLPFSTLLEEENEDPDFRGEEFVGLVLAELGESAQLVESFRFEPLEEVELPAAPAAPEPLAPADELENVAPVQPLPEASEEWTFDLEVMLGQIEEELQDLPEAEREEALGSARAGLQATVVIMEGVQGLAGYLATRVEEESASDEVHLEHETTDLVIAESEADMVHRQELRELARDHARAAAEARAVLEEHERLVDSDRPRAERAERAELTARLHRELEVPVLEDGRVVGRFRTEVSGYEVLHQVLAKTRRDQGEIPFAVDDDGNLLTVTYEDREVLEGQELAPSLAEGTQTIEASGVVDNWVVVAERNPETGLTFGIARPIRETLDEIRRTAARNLTYGLGLIGLAIIGVLPLSRRMTHGLQEINQGAQSIASGDLDTRVPVRSRSEIGELAQAFNSMAEELDQQQKLLVKEERLRRNQEVEQQLLKAEHDRKANELEEARRFQLALLPRRLPEHASFELAVHMRTATEVGGDYYDFRLADDGALTCALGDATGHGAKAGTMVTVIKSLFSAYPLESGLSEFLGDANRAIKRMDLGRMAMALVLARLNGDRLTLSAAGMPPALLHRAGGKAVEELAVEGTPLGSMDYVYRETEVEVRPGDTLLLMSDGFPELLNEQGDPLGYRQARKAFELAATGTPEEMITALEAEEVRWAGEHPPNDDVTFVVVRVK